MTERGANDGTRRGHIVAGIDEAGLGPLLGPLTLGYAAMRLPPEKINLWEALEAVVSRDPKLGEDHIVVADSKRVFARNPRGEKRLETTALAFLGARPGGAPSSGTELLRSMPRSLRPRAQDILESPWYGEIGFALPLWVDAGRMELRRELLHRELKSCGIAVVAAGVRVVPARELNRSFARTANKSLSVWEIVAAILRHLWDEFSLEPLHIIVDRQGGRFRYGRLLASCFPKARIVVGFESPAQSEYQVRLEAQGERRQMRLTFAEKAEDRAFTVALASCFAKYARELGMTAFNDFFTGLLAGLKPTAGYTTDGRRWLKDAEPCLRELELRPGCLQRER